MPALSLQFPDGVTIKSTITSHRGKTPSPRAGLLAVHRPTDGSKEAFVVTHVPTLRVVFRTRLKRDALNAARALENVDWDDVAIVREAIVALRGTTYI